MAPWKRVLGTAVGAVDRAVVVAMQMRGARQHARAEGLSHEKRIAALDHIYAAYGGEELIDDPSAFFPTPPAIDPALKSVRRGSPPRCETFDATWPSTFTPYLEAVAERYQSNVENRTARARLYLGEGSAKKRPAVIAIHGYMGGQWLLEEAQWPIAWLVRRGLDVALPVLPFHAARAGARRGAPPLPSSDPRLTNEGFRQAVTDILALARFLRARGAPHVGVMGMSLGGFTTSLLATVTRGELDFAMPMIPLASVADFAREQGRLGSGHEANEQHAALERANRIVSPLARPLAIPRDRAIVVAAEHDRITPTAHAKRIADHFGCGMITIPGGHLVQLGRSEAFRALATMLERDGIVPARPRQRIIQ